MVEIIPILKADNKTDESKYWFIPMIPNFSRIFENFMYNRIKSFIKQNKLVSLSQYGSSLSISVFNTVFNSRYHENYPDKYGQTLILTWSFCKGKLIHLKLIPIYPKKPSLPVVYRKV